MFTVRLITLNDCEAALDVYRPYVEKTAFTFEYVPPTGEQFREKIKKITAQYPWLVCEYNGKLVGYAYGSTHRDRTAYQWSPESTIYIAEDFHGLGIARILYEALFEMLKLQGFYNVYAGVLVTNENSCKFHVAMGFYEVGLFKRVGYKLGQWHDNMWYQLHLGEHIAEPPTPKVVGMFINTAEFKNILDKANEQIQDITIKQ